MGELTKTSNMAKYSPGPIYKYHDTIKYEDVSDDHLHNKMGIETIMGIWNLG